MTAIIEQRKKAWVHFEIVYRDVRFYIENSVYSILKSIQFVYQKVLS